MRWVAGPHERSSEQAGWAQASRGGMCYQQRQEIDLLPDGFEAFQPNVGVSEFWTPRARPDFKRPDFGMDFTASCGALRLHYTVPPDACEASASATRRRYQKYL